MEELLGDLERRKRMRVLAKRADERWIAGGVKEGEKLAIGSSEDALKGATPGEERLMVAVRGERLAQPENDAPPRMKKDLPAQDPGTTFQPQEWSGKAIKRE